MAGVTLGTEGNFPQCTPGGLGSSPIAGSGFLVSWALPLALQRLLSTAAAEVTAVCGSSESLSLRGVSSLDTLIKRLGIHRFAQNSLSGIPSANKAPSPCRMVITN